MNSVFEPIRLCVPPKAEYSLVIRTALGGVGVIHNLDIDRMDDLMAAADECVDLLLHQPWLPKAIEMACSETEDGLEVRFYGDWAEENKCGKAVDTQMSLAVLNTLIAHVAFETDEYGVKGIRLRQPLTHF